ncbi:MAG: Txe/YoeB family addiction module toxin [Saprospiraceae bacterium]|jgi:toxin YoeB|nr:Txe/YoeB family addiction module toxin [Saprospiraceae bacterium]
MQIVLSPDALAHLDYWRKSGNIVNLKKIEILLDAILLSPFEGIGKPEALKYELSGKWSRRISNEHRFVYSIKDETLYIFSLKGHYK